MIKSLLVKGNGLSIILLFLFFCPAAFGAEMEPQGTPLRKLQRGFLNIAFSPIEISQQMRVEEERSELEPSWFFGGLRGVFYASGRILTGAYEMITFPIPVPANYEPVVEPVFLWEHLNPPENA